MASITVYTYVNPPVIILGEEGTTHGSFAIGDLIKTDTNGQWVIGTGGAFKAIARTGYSAVAGTVIQVELLDPSNLYIIRAGSGVTTAQANCGEEFDVTFGVGAHTALANTTSGADGIIYQLHPEDGAAAGGRYIVKFLPSVIGDTAA